MSTTSLMPVDLLRALLLLVVLSILLPNHLEHFCLLTYQLVQRLIHRGIRLLLH